jgi:palmitoyltransferase
MGLLRTIALVILGFSAFVFTVLFGKLPVFRYVGVLSQLSLHSDVSRKTPIGLLHRIIWIHIPHGISYIDARLFGGQILRSWGRAGNYILYENHPLVLVSMHFCHDASYY